MSSNPMTTEPTQPEFDPSQISLCGVCGTMTHGTSTCTKCGSQKPEAEQPPEPECEICEAVGSANHPEHGRTAAQTLEAEFNPSGVSLCGVFGTITHGRTVCSKCGCVKPAPRSASGTDAPEPECICTPRVMVAIRGHIRECPQNQYYKAAKLAAQEPQTSATEALDETMAMPLDELAKLRKHSQTLEDAIRGCHYSLPDEDVAKFKALIASQRVEAAIAERQAGRVFALTLVKNIYEKYDPAVFKQLLEDELAEAEADLAALKPKGEQE